MTIKFEGSTYEFRVCDTRNIAQEALQELATKTGKVQYDSNYTWLKVPGVGYGWKIQ